MKLLEFTDEGIFCKQAGVYIDPWKPVDKAILTHAHSDHARWGSQFYLCHFDSVPLVKLRLGDVHVDGLGYGETIHINGIKISLHPAGHIIGSAQVRLEKDGEVWAVSGDYKLEDDGVSKSYENVKCDVFVTESTFGLPVYRWKPQQIIYNEINEWWRQNAGEGKTSVLFGYALGKAQRLLQNVDHSIGPVLTHGAIDNINVALISAGIKLKPSRRITPDLPKDIFRNSLVLAPPSTINSPWMKRLHPYSTAIASGWMTLRGPRRRRSVDRGFALSDHADWNGLNKAVKESGADRIVITHGYRNTFARWLSENNFDARVENTMFEGELSEIGESTSPQED